MKNVLLRALTISLFIISCKSEDHPDPIQQPVTYMPVTAGSTWNYELINNTPPATPQTFTLTSTTRDSAINGKQYRVFTNSISANEYYNITGNEYYNFRNLPAALGTSSVEYLYLKDNAGVNSSWSQTYPITVSGVTLNAILTNTVTEKGISKTVKGATYNDVIHVTTTVGINIGGIPLPASAITSDIQSYYAAKIGMIQSVNKIKLDYAGFKDSANQQISLNSYDIK